MESIFIWRDIFTTLGTSYCLRQQCILRKNCSDQITIAYSCRTNWIDKRLAYNLRLISDTKCYYNRLTSAEPNHISDTFGHFMRREIANKKKKKVLSLLYLLQIMGAIKLVTLKWDRLGQFIVGHSDITGRYPINKHLTINICRCMCINS